MSKFCKKCGAPLDPGVKFCNKCGAAIEPEEAPTAPFSAPGRSNTSVFGLAILIAAAVVILSSFLPYVSVSMFGFTESQSLIKGGDGFFFIGLAIVAAVTALLNKPLGTLISGLVTAFLGIFELVDANNKLDEELGELSSLIQKGIGCYLNVIASIALGVLGVLFFLAVRKEKAASGNAL